MVLILRERGGRIEEEEGCRSIIPGSALLDLGDVQLEQVVQPCQELLSIEKSQLVACSMPSREHCR
jgi:hypothetical protein